MNWSVTTQRKTVNYLNTIVILLALAMMMWLMGWMLAGSAGIMVAMMTFIFMLIAAPKVSAGIILKATKARPLPYHQFPGLHRMTAQIAANAGLPAQPKLYAMRSDAINGFAVGTRDDASIVLSDTLLRQLNSREIAGILGHETAHISNNDLYVMAIADISSRITAMLSMAGQILLLLALPSLLAKGVQLSLLPLLLLIFAPTITMLLQLALSRTREYQADLDGTRICGDIHGLVSALRKIDHQQRNLLRRLFAMPWQRQPSPLLLTHPPTEKRIERLLDTEHSSSRSRRYSPLSTFIG